MKLEAFNFVSNLSYSQIDTATHDFFRSETLRQLNQEVGRNALGGLWRDIMDAEAGTLFQRDTTSVVCVSNNIFLIYPWHSLIYFQVSGKTNQRSEE